MVVVRTQDERTELKHRFSATKPTKPHERARAAARVLSRFRGRRTQTLRVYRQAFACRVVSAGLRSASELAPRRPARPQAYGSGAASVMRKAGSDGSRGLRLSVFGVRNAASDRSYLSRRIVAESETATQARLQSRLGRRPPMEARGLHGTAKPWIRRRTHAYPSTPARWTRR